MVHRPFHYKYCSLPIRAELEECIAAVHEQNRSLRDYMLQLEDYVRLVNDTEDSIVEQLSNIEYDCAIPANIPICEILEGDHAGHLAGDRFGGSPELDKIVSQSTNVNLSQYKKIENQCAKAISEGKEVTVNVNIKYDGVGLRPIEFNVEYTIDGKYYSKDIMN